jgi:aspartyl-tRNA(Asn)/glutamyl-tRNA(Gln) amidotransferase subunit A
MTNTLNEMSLADLGALIRARQVSPVEVTDQALARIEELNPRLNAFWTVTAELAREQARAAETEITKGEYRGPLHGVPVGLKDLIWTRGIRTTFGSKITRDFVPDADAAVVEKLRNAGAVLIGKTALHEFAYGITNDNPHFGPTRNPWDPQRTPGGSSGGSGVAVATGMCYAALGTDTGGSIRIPASFCGVVGLKPTLGRVSLRNIQPLGYTLDHAGPIARTVVDVGLVYQVIAGYDPEDEFSVDRPLGEIVLRKSLAGIRVGLPEDFFFDALQPEVEQAVRKAIEVMRHLGAEIIPVAVPFMPRLVEVARDLLLVEAYAVHANHFRDRPNDLGDDLKALFEKGRELTAQHYVETQRLRHRLCRELEQLFDQVNVIVTPTTPLTAFPIGSTSVTLGGKEYDARAAATRFTREFNASGHPALALPCGFDAEGLPIGLQVVGRLWDEAAVLHVGYAYEQATEWHTRRPPTS